MSVIVTKQRYNWMGYNGTETQEVDTALLRGENAPVDNYNYDHRQQVIAELKERLYQIKRDLDLLPEEELRAEEEARQRRREDRKRREDEARRRRVEEEAARAEEEERQRVEQEERAEERRRQQEAEEQRHREQETEAQKNAERWRQLHDDSDDDSDVEEEQNEALSNMPRSQAEIDAAVGGFAKGTRMLIASSGQGYVSYLDGSVHTTMAGLEAHNEKNRAAAVVATAGSSVSVPPAEEFALDDVQANAARHQLLRRKVDAYRALQDPTYAARVRASEKNINGQPSIEITPEDGDEAALTAQVQEARQHAEEVRTNYNARAAASGRAIAAVMCSRAGGAAPAAEAAEAAEAEAAVDRAVAEGAPAAPMAEGTAPAAMIEQPAEEAAAAPPALAEEAMVADEAPLADKLPTPAAAATPMEDEDEL